MFAPCPHCQFLIAQHPQQRTLPQVCPRCGKPLDLPGEADDLAAPPIEAGADADLENTAHVPSAEAPVDAIAEPAAPLDVQPAPALPPQPARAWHARMAQGMQRRPARWQWSAVVVLAALLLLQLLLADRARLAADPGWRPWLERGCTVLRCSLPTWHEPAAFSMLDRKVRPATTAGVLRVEASFRNDARWPQAWPALQLSLADADGRTLGSQVFSPAQYLGQAPDTLIAPGQSAAVEFLVHEPAPGTVAFSFDFR